MKKSKYSKLLQALYPCAMSKSRISEAEMTWDVAIGKFKSVFKA
jgi:hypothetical protein